jgi:hypothetical protein
VKSLERGSGPVKGGSLKTKTNERKSMNSDFDQLTKNIAQAVTRRQAFKRLGVGLAGMALACFGLRDKANAAKARTCDTNADCDKRRREICWFGYCARGCTSHKDCPAGLACHFGVCGG